MAAPQALRPLGRAVRPVSRGRSTSAALPREARPCTAHPPAPAGGPSLYWRRPCRLKVLRSPLARRRCLWPLPVAREWAALPA